MYELKWMHNIPSQNFEGALKFLNELGWNLKIEQRKGHWLLFAGESAVFKSTAREELEAFVYGLALAYAVMPQSLLRQFREFNESEQSGRV